MAEIQVQKAGSESNASVIRRFSKRVQGAGVLRKARDLRYSLRKESDLKKRQSALKRISKREEVNRLRKLGKIKDVVYRKSN